PEIETDQRSVVHRDRTLGKEQIRCDERGFGCLHTSLSHSLRSPLQTRTGASLVARSLRSPLWRLPAAAVRQSPAAVLQQELRYRLGLAPIGERETMLDDLADGDHRDAMLLREQLEVGNARRRTVVVQHLTDDRDRRAA